MKANRREDEVVTCGPGSPQDSHHCQSCWCSLPTGVPQEDPKRAHVVCGPQKDGQQVAAERAVSPRHPFNTLDGIYVCQIAASSQLQDTASLYGVMILFPAV